MLKRNFLPTILTLVAIMTTATVLMAQSYYKTYPQRTPGYTYDLHADGAGYKIFASDSDFASISKNFFEVKTDGSGNIADNQAHNLGTYGNRAITWRTKSGLYIFMDTDNSNGRMRARIVNRNGSLVRTATLTFPAGHTAVAGAATEYSNGDVLVTYYHGAAWSDPFNIPQRRIRWARVRPSNGAIISQGSMLSRRVDSFQANTPINAVAVSPNGSIFIANIEEVPISQRHYLTKINPNGTEAWSFETATLERGIFRLEGSSDHGAIYNHTQSREGVTKTFGSSGGTGFYFHTEAAFMKNMARELFVPTNDGGAFIIAHDIQTGTGFLRPSTIHTAKVSSNGTILAQNIITQAGPASSHKRPTAAIINSAGELVVSGWVDPTPSTPFVDGHPFLLKLGTNGQWVADSGGSGIDLELTSNSNNPNPNVWEATSMTVTLKNTGNRTATNTKVKVEIPSTLILQGGNEYQASQGSFSPYGNRIWNVGSVAAGSTKTLTLNFYNPNTNIKSVFAQVQSHNGGNDSDSTPGNGTCCTGLEDDETYVEFNGGGGTTRFADLTGSDLRMNQTTAPQGSVVNYTFDLTNLGPGVAIGDYKIQAYLSTNQLTGVFGTKVGIINTGNTGVGTIQDVPGAITVPGTLTPARYYLHLEIDSENDILESTIANNSVRGPSIVITRSTTPAKPDLTPTNVVPSTFDVAAGGTMGVNLSAVNNGGPIPSSQLPFIGRLYLSTNTSIEASDFLVGSLTMGTGGASIGGTVPSNIPAGQYYALVQLDATNVVDESNENNNVGRNANRITVTRNTGGSGAIDLNMSTSNSNPSQWGSFSVTLTAKNTGSSNASNVKINFKKPDAVTYRGGAPFTSSKGSFSWWGNEEWNIGSLGANQTATITVNYFRLSAGGFTVSANVKSGGGNDAASINFGSAANGINNRSAVINNMVNEPFAIVNAYPNPTTDYITVSVYSNKEKASNLEIFSLSGKRVFQKSYDLIEGVNDLKIETAQFSTGQYFVKMAPFHPYLRKIDFTKVK